MRKITVVLCSLYVCFLTLFAPVTATPGYAGDVVSWKFFISYPPSLFPILPQFPDMVKKETNGKLDVKMYFFGEHPYKGSEIMKALRDDKCQLGEIEGIYCAGYEPVLALTGTPMVAGSYDQMIAMHEALMKEGLLQKVYDRYNIFEAAYWVWFGPAISCKDTLINDMNSLKGKKIRVPSRQHAEVVKWLGGSPVTISWGEVYSALQRGVIDGAIGSLAGQKNSKWYEVCKYTTRMAEAFGMDRICVNKEAFGKLDKDVQDGLIRAIKQYETMKRNQMRGDDALATVEIMHKNGVTVRAMPAGVMDEIVKKAKPFMAEWAQESGKGAPEANQVLMQVLGW